MHYSSADFSGLSLRRLGGGKSSRQVKIYRLRSNRSEHHRPLAGIEANLPSLPIGIAQTSMVLPWRTIHSVLTVGSH